MAIEQPKESQTPAVDDEASKLQLQDPYYGGPLGAGIDWTDPNSPLAPFYFSTAGVVAAALLAVAFFLLSIMPLMHTDFWSHLKYGEWIVTHWAIPSVEPLCRYTDKHRPFFDAMWLAQVVYFITFRAGEALGGADQLRSFEGGVEVIRWLHLLAATVALALFGWAIRQVSNSAAWGAVAIGYGIVLIQPLLAVQRPQTLAFVPFMLVLIILSKAVRAGDKQIPKRTILLLPLILLVWANLHGSFIVGLVLAGLTLAGHAGEKLVIGPERSLRQLAHDTFIQRWALALLIAVVAIAALNPYGPALYVRIAQFGNHPNLRTMAEWQPLEWTLGPGGLWSYLFTVILLLATLLVTRRCFGLSRWLVLGVFGLWPLFQQRMMAWWTPLALWLVAPLWVDWAVSRNWNLSWGIPSFRKTALAGLILLIGLVASPASLWLKQGRPRSFATALYPATPFGVAKALRNEPQEGSSRAQRLLPLLQQAGECPWQGPIFCSERLGEYLLWALSEQAPVMMYNHAQLFTEEHWHQCLAAKEGQPEWDSILQRYGARLLVVETLYHPHLCMQVRQHPQWEVLLDEGDVQQLPPDARLLVARRRP
ncbi:MAG: hypothetical protein NZU63_11295 [Gemmataceae bacterium]|nr:hypothetical protein [Gemmataceae bacterium]MDW8241658.1 hypothetical protein [Thermogemmata sp.]